MDSLTTIKHQSSQPLLNMSSEAEQNNTSPVEQEAFIKTDRRKTAAISIFRFK